MDFYRSFGVLSLTLLSMACAPRSRMSPPRASFEPAAESEEVAASVRVTNHNRTAVDIYAISAAQSYRLGTVAAGKTTTFTLPATVVEAPRMQLMAYPMALDSRVGYVTDHLAVRPGVVIELTIENDVSLSNLSGGEG